MNEVRALPPGPDAVLLSAPDQGAHDSPFAFFGRVHRLLRGRYLLVVPATILCAIAGGVGGFMLTTPKYESVGAVRIQSVIPVKVYGTPENGSLLNTINNHVRTTANYLQDEQVLSRAMRSPEWQAFKRGLDPDAQDKFRDSLDVVTNPLEQEWIRVKFRDPDPKAAKAAVEQIFEAYKSIHGADEVIVSGELVSDIQIKKKNQEGVIDAKNAQLLQLANKYGTTDLAPLQKDTLDGVRALNKQIDELDLRIKQAESAGPQAPAPAATVQAKELDAEGANAAIARLDPVMQKRLFDRDTAQAELDRLNSSGFGPQYRPLLKAQGLVQAAQKQVDDYRTQWVSIHGPPPVQGGPDQQIAPLSADQLPVAKTTLANLKTRRDRLQGEMVELNKAALEIERVQSDLKEQKTVLADYDRRLTELNTEAPTNEASTISARIKIYPPLEAPHKPAADSRRKLGAVGFLFGAGFPLGCFMLWGLLDRRYRYSDDAGQGRLHPTLLGILPYLPDNMADPEQAAVAAHCVHQIRTLLQISGAQQDRRVFAVTSPTSGDGKTSLSLSLGLSFAASGAETCLIDFDMVGGGLSSSMQAKADLGLMDALEKGELNGHIRRTAFPRLSILPVGREDSQEVSRLSPELVRRVLDEARRRFDVVVIDTGPILGSIEAGLVTAAADGVILTIGRGQGRTQTERAMEYLSSVGATLVGVVFNRADPGDFRRAVSSASVRSVPVQNGLARRRNRDIPALGPMANTVAGHIGPGNDEAAQ